MSCISIFDHIRLDFCGSQIAIRCSHPAVPEDGTNLAHEAAERFYAAVGNIPLTGLRIQIDKKIPVAAGLGGGSSNAATVLMGLNAHHGYPLAPEALSRIGMALGADVPFFLFGKPALASGIGEHLEGFNSLPAYHVVVIFPGFAVSTATVFTELNLGLTNPEKKPTKALLKKRGFIAPDQLHNDLETVAVRAHPEIAAAKNRLASLGAIGVLMSGSGPSVFGLFYDEQTALRAKTNLKKESSWQVYVATLITEPADIAAGSA